MRISATQFAMMVDFMERNGDLAKPQRRPRGRQLAAMKWRELAAKLNSNGSGESRSEDKWRKVWTDLKNNTMRKSSKLYRSMTGTGGSSAWKTSLTDLEQRVLNIMGDQAATGMTTVPEIGFEHAEQEQEVVMIVEPVPSPKVDRQGDEDWSLPSTSQEQPHSVLTREADGASAVVPPAAQNRKWIPRHKRAKKQDVADEFLKYESLRDERYFALEKERLRQRDVELNLQYKWLEFMNEALSVLRKFMEEKKRDE